MAQLSTKIKLYCEANSKTADFGPDGNVTLQDDSDGKGPYIKSWTVDGLTKPTDEQVASYETAGNTEESNNTVRATRKAAYGDIGDQLDEIYKDIDAWKVRIKAVKDANPKG
tara:strand:+ start:1674 stop:2009 length:336 start_codon:yes stop_codon:yes gene_type:complete